MKVNGIFYSLQGEGRFVGHPAIFVRLAGCNLNCEWCDTKYANKKKNYKEMSPMEVSEKILKMVSDVISDYPKHMRMCFVKFPFVVFTGGEPTLQINQIYDVINRFSGMRLSFHLETNGTHFSAGLNRFDYIAFSPKNSKDAENVFNFVKAIEFDDDKYDIKIVIDCEEYKPSLIQYATMLMPMTTFDEMKDKEIKIRTWHLCVKLNKKYSPRVHIDVHGKKRAV